MPSAIVIDDSRAMRILLGDAMRALGYTVAEAEQGRMALDRLETDGPCELALVDWNMPVMNGLEFIRAVRARPDWQGMRILVITSETEVEQVMLALQSGADEYLMKPFTPDTLASKLAVMGLLQELPSGTA